MWKDARDVLTAAFTQLRRNWRDLALTDLAFRAIAFAILSPGAALLLRWAMSSVDAGALADADIARFFITTKAGFAALLGVSTVTVAITVLEMTCLMGVAFAAVRGLRLAPGRALAYGAAKAPLVLALAGHMVLRVLVGVTPFLAAGGLVYWTLLREHDINYYLAERPPAFWAAAVLIAVIAAAFVALLVRTITRWALALPLVLFEKVLPGRALGASAARSKGHRWTIVVVLAAWSAFGLATTALAGTGLESIGRAVAPLLVGRIGLLMLFVTGLVAAWFAVVIGVAIVNVALFSLVILGLYQRTGEPSPVQVPGTLPSGSEPPFRLSGRARAAAAGIVLLGCLGIVLLMLFVTRQSHDVAVIAHRGSSLVAPENSLAAFRLAIEEGADYVELDVQESTDGVVVVAHDIDLMKIGGSPLKIWETSAAEIRAVPIGRRGDPKYADERVPTLAEVLALCKGRVRVIIELKSYGYDQQLEERVAALVEAAGMQDDCVYMSLDLKMAARMKKLRPEWRVGILVAKAIGNLNTIETDFLAVEARMATARFVRRAHRAGHEVYVWTVNDPAWMFAALSKGVDGLITDVPAVAREAVERRKGMSDAQRFLMALMIRLGARTEVLAAEDALRP